ncbi:DUF6515 family protein [Terrimonas rubra]|uniref:DUF6515 family protein n=1 Tax=Terrimonas rubra TaxID=1035890 RepID=A0ABW6A289_9BACT
MIKNYKYSLPVFFSVALLLFVADAQAQRRYYPRSRGRVTVYHRPPVMVRHYAPRIYAYNRPFVSINFGGMGYRYQHGYFYRPMGTSFQVVTPPFGIRVGILPVGYSTFMMGTVPYYYYNNVYYRQLDNEYEVVAPPLGARVTALPPKAAVKVINGEKYYELDGTYYSEYIDDKGKLRYEVVGTDGVLNTGTSAADAADAVTVDEPEIGDRINDLPENSKAVVIKGEKLFLTPDGKYYKEVLEGEKIVYELVGQ